MNKFHMDKALPPLPWSYEDNGPVDRPLGHGFLYLIDANGRKIGTFWGKPAEKIATAALVIDASDRWSGSQDSVVETMVSDARDPLEGLSLDAPLRKQLDAAARARGMRPITLVANIVSCVIGEDILSAVLDDGESP